MGCRKEALSDFDAFREAFFASAVVLFRSSRLRHGLASPFIILALAFIIQGTAAGIAPLFTFRHLLRYCSF